MCGWAIRYMRPEKKPSIGHARHFNVHNGTWERWREKSSALNEKCQIST